MKNQVIEVLDREHGKKVIQYWRDRGVDTRGKEGILTKEKVDSHRYYGVIDGVFHNYSERFVKDYNATIITLPEPEPEKEWKPKRGERVFVWNNNDDNVYKGIFITEVEGATRPFVTVAIWGEKDFENGLPFDIISWKNMKPIPQVKEVTMQEIADKFGVEVEQLKIKE